MTQRIQQISDIVVITLAILLGYIVVKNYFFAPTASQDLIKPGERIHLTQGVDWTRSDRTLLVAMRVGCGACSESAPFYKRLGNMGRSGQTDVQLLTVFPDESATVRRYLDSEGLDLDAASNVQLKSLNISATPSLILVSREGVVLRSWQGILSPKRELEVIDAIKRPTVGSRLLRNEFMTDSSRKVALAVSHSGL